MQSLSRPYHGIQTYALMAHGLLNCPLNEHGSFMPEDPITLPDNVMVIMNCYSEPQAVDKFTLNDQAIMYKTYMERIFETVKHGGTSGPNLDFYVDQLLKISSFNTENRFCIFQNACPNLTLEIEKNKWRDGLYHLPIVCHDLDVVLGLGTHLDKGHFEACGNTYKRFAKPAYNRGFDSTIKNAHMRQASRMIEHQAPTLRDVLTRLWTSMPNPERHVHVVIVHACTTSPFVDERRPYSVRYDKTCLTEANKTWIMFWFGSRLRLAPGLAGGKTKNPSNEKKKKKINKVSKVIS